MSVVPISLSLILIILPYVLQLYLPINGHPQSHYRKNFITYLATLCLPPHNLKVASFIYLNSVDYLLINNIIIMSFYIFHTKCSSIMPHCYRRSSEYLLGIHYPQIIALTIFEYFQMYVRSYSPDKEPHFRQSHIPTFYDVQSYLHYLYHNTILMSCSQTTSVYSQHYLFFNHSLAGRVTRPDLNNFN